MKINIKKIAQEAVTFSELMSNREKIETEQIIKYHEEGITITSIDPVTVIENDEEKMFYVYLIKEEPKKFAFSGYVLRKIFDNLLNEFNGDLGALNAELESSGDLRVKLKSSKTRDGKRQVTAVEVI